MSKVLFVLGDIHIPYMSWKAINQVADDIKRAQDAGDEVKVVQVGDLLDMRAWSRWPKDAESENAQREWDNAEIELEKLNKLIPQMHIIFGNHDRRIATRASESQMPRQLVKTLDHYFDFPGWKWHAGTDPLIINDVMVLHGDETTYSSAGHLATKYGRSVVYGHTHRMSLEYMALFDKKYWGMNVGWLGDVQQTAFNYSRQSPGKYQLGYGVVVDGIPMLVPLEV